MRVFARHHAGQGKAFWQVHWHVFERMHGNVGTAFLQGDLKLFDKQTLAANFAERPVQNLVTHRRHAQQLNLPAKLRFKQRFDMFGLPKCQPAFAGGYDYFFHCFFRC